MWRRIAQTRYLVLVGGLALAMPVPLAIAQSPTLKELLEKAQSKSDAIAVEEIVKGLKPKTEVPKPDSAKPDLPKPDSAKAEPSTASPPLSTTAEPVKPADVPQTAEPAKPAEPAVAAPAAPPVPVSEPAAATVTATEPARTEPAAMPQLQPPAAVATPATPVEKPAVEPAPSEPKPEPATQTVTREVKDDPPPSLDFEVLFAFDSADIAEASHPLLVRIGTALTDTRLANRRFDIVGHTDGKGAAAYNLALSQRRAAAVRTFLLENFEIAPARLTAVGKGENELKNKKNPRASENRRVEIISLPDAQGR